MNIAFNILLTVSQGVWSCDDYYGKSCAFCGCGERDKHNDDCETILAVQAMQQQFGDLYTKHLNDIELARLAEIEKQRQYKLKLEREHAKKYVICEKCGVEVRRADYAMHIDHKRCLINQRRNQAQRDQILKQQHWMNTVLMLEQIEQM